MKASKNLFIYFVSVNLIVFTSSCMSKEEPDSVAVANERNDAKFNKDLKRHADFLVEVADLNMCEMKQGEIAASRASLACVNEFGEKMMEDHKHALEIVRTLAERKGISLPDTTGIESDKKIRSLEDEDSDDFNLNYLKMMIEGHKITIDKFERAAEDSTDSEMQEYANSVLPELRRHLDMAYQCEEKCKAAAEK